MKYLILRAVLRYHDDKKDVLYCKCLTNNLNDERAILKAKYNCKGVEFVFREKP